MKVTKITLEDNGQDFLELYVDDKGKVIDAQPFQGSIWAGAMIPLGIGDMVEPGKLLPIHNPPHIEYGFLKHKIEKVEEVEYEEQ